MQRPTQSYRHLLENLARQGRALAIGIPTDITTGAATNIVAKPGQVAVILKVVGQTTGNIDTSPDGAITEGLSLTDAAAQAAGTMSFRNFRRPNVVFQQGVTPSFRNANPCFPVQWEPSFPILVPPGWTLQSSQTGAFGNGFAAYGFLCSVGDIRALGIEVPTTDTAAHRHVGYSGASIDSTSEVTLISGRAGYSIQILDLYVRMQPQTFSVSTPNVLTIYQDDGSTERNFLRLTCNNPSDNVDAAMTPGIYLKAGADFKAKGSRTDVGSGGSVAVIYRYVKSDSVPQNHFWSEVSPNLPTPGTTQIGTLSLLRRQSTTVTLYYPAKDTTATAPGAGFQHVVHGWSFNCQKGVAATPDFTAAALTTGTAGGNLGASLAAVTQTNDLISPILWAGSHDQFVHIFADKLFVPCGKKDGLLLVDTFSAGTNGVTITSTPTATDSDVDEWSWSVWGETVPALHRTEHFQGAAT